MAHRLSSLLSSILCSILSLQCSATLSNQLRSDFCLSMSQVKQYYFKMWKANFNFYQESSMTDDIFCWAVANTLMHAELLLKTGSMCLFQIQFYSIRDQIRIFTTWLRFYLRTSFNIVSTFERRRREIISDFQRTEYLYLITTNFKMHQL